MSNEIRINLLEQEVLKPSQPVLLTPNGSNWDLDPSRIDSARSQTGNKDCHIPGGRSESLEMSVEKHCTPLSEPTSEDRHEDMKKANSMDALLSESHMYVDKLSEELHLASSQAAELHGLVDRGSSFEYGELTFKLRGVANAFKTQNLLYEVLMRYESIETHVKQLKEMAIHNETQSKLSLALIKQLAADTSLTDHKQLDQNNEESQHEKYAMDTQSSPARRSGTFADSGDAAIARDSSEFSPFVREFSDRKCRGRFGKGDTFPHPRYASIRPQDLGDQLLEDY